MTPSPEAEETPSPEEAEKEIRAIISNGWYWVPDHGRTSFEGFENLLPKPIPGDRECELVLDFSGRKASLLHYFVSHHNGDPYDVQTVKIPWGKAIESVYPIFKKKAHLAIRKLIEEETQKKMEQKVEATYKKLVATKEASTSFFERLVGED